MNQFHLNQPNNLKCFISMTMISNNFKDLVMPGRDEYRSFFVRPLVKNMVPSYDTFANSPETSMTLKY